MAVEKNQSALRRLRQGHVERVLELLRTHGPLSRTQIADLTGLSRTTLSDILGRLLADGVLAGGPVQDAAPAGRGRPAHLLTLNPSSAQAAGIEIGRDRIRVVIANAAHEITASGGEPCPTRADISTRAEMAVTCLRRVADAASVDLRNLAGVGVGTPGPGETARTGESPRPGQRAAPPGRQAVADLVSERLGAPVLVDNNIRLAALGEAIWGSASGVGDVLYVSLSQGVGGGLVLGGRLFRGAFGGAGEIGHISVKTGGPACWCGNHGCLERFASVPALLRAAGRRNWQRLWEAAQAGEERACHVVADAGGLLGQALAAACSTVNPGRVVVGGEVASLGSALLDPAEASFRAHSAGSIHRGVRLVPAALADRGGALGGLALTLQESPLLAGYTAPVTNTPPEAIPQGSRAAAGHDGQ